jgi:endonuclease/exonuclease/phosphatase family metal-dependent hydrolase
MTIGFTGIYTQNFDTLTSLTTSQAWSNDGTLDGWYLFRQPAPGTALSTYLAFPANSTTGSFYSFGSTDAERALGGQGSGGSYFGSPSSGSVAGWIAFAAINETGSTISQLEIGFDAEQWRNGGNTSAQSMVLEYGFGSSFTTVASWTAPGGSFDWSSPVVGSTAAMVDGNAAGLLADRGGVLAGLDWQAGQTLWLRWIERNDSGNDHALAIDNFSLTLPATLPTVTLTVDANAGSEAAATVITLTATASSVLPSEQTVQVLVSGAGISAGDYSMSSTTIVIPAGGRSGSVSFSVLDDGEVEGPETATLSLASPSGGIVLGSPSSQAITIADNDAPPAVSLSLDRSVAREADGTLVTVTATAAAAVTSAQTVTIAIGGTGITASDTLLPASLVITIAAGGTSGSLQFNIADDTTPEGDENLSVAIVATSSGLLADGASAPQLQVVDHVDSLLTRVGAAASAHGAEVPAFDASSGRLFVVAGSTVEAYAIGSSGALSLLGSLVPGFAVDAGTAAVPNSVAARDGLVAVAYAIVDQTSDAQRAGKVAFFEAATGVFLRAVEVGYLPDMVVFSPDGTQVLTADEGEPNSYGQADSFDPEGSVSLVDLRGGVMAATVTRAGFSAFDALADDLRAVGVRLFGPGATVSQDLEPEYIGFTADGRMAVVTLQENNAVALVDLASGTVGAVAPLGTRDFSRVGQGLDASDRDSGSGGPAIDIGLQPVHGLYQPDAIASFGVGGQWYYITANEGDARDYTGFSEEVRVGSGSYVLDPAIFPDAASLKSGSELGRLTVTNASGDIDGDSDFDRIETFGSRSFTIRDATGAIVFDSGDQLEQLTAARARGWFNSDGTAASFDGRSDNKGPEPEGVVVGQVGSRHYAFIGLERVGDIVVYEVTNPAAPVFVQYVNLPEDVSPEVLTFVPAADSPTGQPLLISANEVSRTVSVFEIAVPVRIADIQGAAHRSPLEGQAVRGVEGIVTQLAGNGFYLQDPLPDANPATSEGVFVFTGSGSPLLAARSIGEAVRVTGTVSEFRPGGNPDNLSITQIGHTPAVQSLEISAWSEGAGLAITATSIGNGGRQPPTELIHDDVPGNVETGGDFDPAAEGIDFWESLEGMQVRVDDPLAVSPTNSFGEIWVLADGGAGASSRTVREGSLVVQGDFNPERIQLDNLGNFAMPTVDVGARLADVVGVVSYGFENYEVLLGDAPAVVQASPLEREVSSVQPADALLHVATLNVENLDPGDGPARFATIAAAIVDRLRSPDILSLEEVQDNNGPVNDGVVAADLTLQMLINAIATAGGPVYEYRQIDPVDDQDGGEPGGNIRVAFLFDPSRVDFVDGSLQRLTDPDLGDGDAFASSRKPLVGQFEFNGEVLTLVGNHFNSKGSDQPLFGPNQPPALVSEAQRVAQAEVVGDYVAGLLGADPQARVLVLGDLNDFGFSAPLQSLQAVGLNSLLDTLPAGERYTYNFQGNAQALDHMLASDSLLDALQAVDVVHYNAEFAEQLSDHDPVLAGFLLEPAGQLRQGTTGRDTLVGTPGRDTLVGGAGRDTLTGGGSADRFVYQSVVDGPDQITDFVPGSDVLDVAALLATVGYTGSNAVADGWLGVRVIAGKTQVYFDADGAAGSGVPRLLVELLGVEVHDAQGLLGGGPGQG